MTIHFNTACMQLNFLQNTSTLTTSPHTLHSIAKTELYFTNVNLNLATPRNDRATWLIHMWSGSTNILTQMYSSIHINQIYILFHCYYRILRQMSHLQAILTKNHQLCLTPSTFSDASRFHSCLITQNSPHTNPGTTT